MASAIRIAGFAGVGVTVTTGLMQEKVQRLRQTFSKTGVESFLRIDLNPASRRDLLKLLRRYRNSYDLIAVKCVDQHTASVACRDTRVDVVYFNAQNPKMRLTHSLANQLNGAVEFNLIADLTSGAVQDIVPRVLRDVGIARDHKVPVVISSGSTSAYGVRSPMQLAALATVLGFSHEQSIAALTDAPRSIISKNVQKRSNTYVEEGVLLVESRNRSAS